MKQLWKLLALYLTLQNSTVMFNISLNNGGCLSLHTKLRLLHIEVWWPNVSTWAVGELESGGTVVTLLPHHPWQTQALTRQGVAGVAVRALGWTLAGWWQETSQNLKCMTRTLFSSPSALPIYLFGYSWEYNSHRGKRSIYISCLSSLWNVVSCRLH